MSNVPDTKSTDGIPTYLGRGDPAGRFADYYPAWEDKMADGDPMIPPHLSCLLAGLVPQARVKIYPDAAHGFLFQHHAEFASDVDAFLREPESSRGGA